MKTFNEWLKEMPEINSKTASKTGRAILTQHGFPGLDTKRNKQGENIVKSSLGKVAIVDENGNELEVFKIPYNSILMVANNDMVKPGTVLFQHYEVSPAIAQFVNKHYDK